MSRINQASKAIAGIAMVSIAAGCSLVPDSVNDALGNTIHVTADFENIAGVYEGNEVAVLGLTVGKIDKIEPKGEYVLVQMSLDKDAKVPAEAIAASVSPSVVTNRHIELTPAYAGDGPTLSDGDHIPLGRTRTPVEIGTLIKTIDEFAAALSPSAANPTGPLSADNLYQVLNGHGEDIRRTLDALSGALKTGLDNQDAVSNSIIKLNELTQMIADNDQTVREFSGNITQMSQLLADQAPGLQSVLAQLNDFLANTSSVLAENRQAFGDSLTRLSGTTLQMRQNARSLIEIVDVTPLLFQNIDNAVSREERAVRLHALTDRALFDNELLNLFCERIQMRSEGCRTGKLKDFGPDLGLTAALLGVIR
jgi:phospholipid/cholesterol/gamma-HCH transport system substrate-binding protein